MKSNIIWFALGALSASIIWFCVINVVGQEVFQMFAR